MFLTILLNFISSYLICSIFEDLFIFFIVIFGLIVLNCEILSLLHLFNTKSIIIASFINFVVSFLFWYKLSKKPYIPNLKDTFRKIYNSLKLDKTLIVFLFFFLFMLLSFLFLSIYSLPLEPDSRFYYFSRVFEFIRQGSFNHFDTDEIRNIIMPFNSEIIYTYFYIFKNNDFSFGLLSYFSFIFLITGLFNIFKEFKISTRKALFSIFVFSSLALILVQIPSLQTDILTASFIIASIYLYIKASNRNSCALIYFSSLAYAIAIGIKTTAIMDFVAFIVVIISFNLIFKKNYNNILKFILCLTLNFIIFSSYNYILNYIDFHNFLAPYTFQAEHKVLNLVDNFKTLISNFINNPFLIMRDERVKGFSVTETLFILYIIIVSLFAFFKTTNKKIKMISVFGITFVLNFIIHCVSIDKSLFSIRYFVEFIALTVPAFYFSYFKRVNFVKFLVLPFCIYNFTVYSISSSRCPLYTFLLFDFDKNMKSEIILKCPYTDKEIIEDYLMSGEFIKKFKKEDKVLVLNHEQFYEIKKLTAYNLKFVSFNYMTENNLDDFDYIIIKENREITNNPKHFTDKIEDKNYTIGYYIKKTGKLNIPILKKYDFKDDFFIEKGFVPTEKTRLFKTFANIKHKK